MRTALTIAGSDSCGGAGIQADLKTFLVNGVYGMSAITALTAQNTLGITMVEEVSTEMVHKQLEMIFEDIRPDAIKIGMLNSEKIVRVVGDVLRKYEARNIVLDPILVSSSGRLLLEEAAIPAMIEELFPLATVITPNIPEAEVLSGMKAGSITNGDQMENAARKLLEMTTAAVLVKGSHLNESARDLLCYEENGCRQYLWFSEQKLITNNTHGTGCTLSSAIAAGLAKDFTVRNAVGWAKQYVTGAIQEDLEIGHGAGPLNHGWQFGHNKDFM